MWRHPFFFTQSKLRVGDCSVFAMFDPTGQTGTDSTGRTVRIVGALGEYPKPSYGEYAWVSVFADPAVMC